MNTTIDNESDELKAIIRTEVKEKLGEGASGEVYRAMWGSDVALKLFRVPLPLTVYLRTRSR